MSQNRIVTRIINRNDTADRWLQLNPILHKAEIGIENDTGKFKIGNGVDDWKTLEYAGSGFNPGNAALLESITQEMIDEWSGAQPNTIEKIFVNNNEVIIQEDKSVHLSVAVLGEDGKILSSQLPSFVDDIIEVETFEKLPAKGESGKIYITTNDGKTYRWSGTQYVPIGNDLVLGETAETAFRGDYGKIAYEHAVLAEHAPTTPATIDKLGLVKSATGANYVNVSNDGTMKVGVVSTTSLAIPIGDKLILDGGTADDSDPTYSTRIGNIGYNNIQAAINNAVNGDVVILQENINLGTQDNNNLIIESENVTLNLNSKIITANGSNGAIKVTGGLTNLIGDGVIEGTLGSDNYSMALWVTNGKVVIDGGTYRNATDGSDRGTDLIYVSRTGQIEINGGIFEAAKPEWTLNCKDSDYQAGTASIIVKGGKFLNFDPANNNTEGAGTNYVAEGYISVKEGNYYVVKKVN